VAASASAHDDDAGLHAGWIAGALVIAGVFAVGAFFWFRYHP